MNNLISCPCTLQAGCQCNTLKLNLHLNGAWDCDNHNLPDKILLIPRRRRERHGRDDDGRHGKTEERVRRQQDLVGLQALLSGEGDVDAAAKARFSTRQRFSIPFGLCFLFQRSLKSALGPCSLPCLSNSQIRVISISNRPPNSINSAFKFKSNTKFSIRQRFSIPASVYFSNALSKSANHSAAELLLLIPLNLSIGVGKSAEVPDPPHCRQAPAAPVRWLRDARVSSKGQ